MRHLEKQQRLVKEEDETPRCVCLPNAHVCMRNIDIEKTDMQRLNSFEMKCYRKVLGIRWNQFVRNERVKELVSRPKEIVETIIGRKMSMFGHIYMQNGGKQTYKKCHIGFGGREERQRTP